MARAKSLRTLAWIKSEGICYLCGLWMPPPGTDLGEALRYTIDHVIPKSKGGTNDLENLNGSHQYCNNFKQDTLIEELPQGWKRVIRWKINNLLIHAKIVT